MMSLTISEGLLTEALAHLRDCGKGKRECVCWLTGPLARPGLLNGLLRPEHRASAGDYEISERWLNDTFIDLAHAGRELRAQIHSHPAGAYHSPTDDAYPAVTNPGFASIVVAAFARTGLDGAHLSELDGHARWQAREISQALVIT